MITEKAVADNALIHGSGDSEKLCQSQTGGFIKTRGQVFFTIVNHLNGFVHEWWYSYLLTIQWKPLIGKPMETTSLGVHHSWTKPNESIKDSQCLFITSIFFAHQSRMNSWPFDISGILWLLVPIVDWIALTVPYCCWFYQHGATNLAHTIQERSWFTPPRWSDASRVVEFDSQIGLFMILGYEPI